MRNDRQAHFALTQLAEDEAQMAWTAASKRRTEASCAHNEPRWMKWLYAVMLAAAIVICCTACGGGGEESPPQNQDKMGADPTACAPGQLNCK